MDGNTALIVGNRIGSFFLPWIAVANRSVGSYRALLVMIVFVALPGCECEFTEMAVAAHVTTSPRSMVRLPAVAQLVNCVHVLGSLCSKFSRRTFTSGVFSLLYRGCLGIRVSKASNRTTRPLVTMDPDETRKGLPVCDGRLG